MIVTAMITATLIKRPIVIGSLILLTCSCTSIKRDDSQERVSSIPATSPVANTSPVTAVANSDTTITYDIEGISTEGCSARASYRFNKLYKCFVQVFGCSGETELQYTVSGDTIAVMEVAYKYTVPREKLSCPGEIQETNSLKYTFDRITGKITTTTPSPNPELFRAIFEKVPLSL